MDENPSDRRRRWPWVVLALLIAAALLPMVILPIVFLVRAIPPDRMTAPPSLLTIKPATQNPELKSIAPEILPAFSNQMVCSLQLQYIAFAKTKEPSSPAIPIYEKWRRWMNRELPDQFNTQFMTWQIDQPLSAQQKEWLTAHQEFIRDMQRLAAAGGFPSMSCEDAASFNDRDLSMIQAPNFWNPNYPTLGYIARILIAESIRLRQTGDQARAIQPLLAIEAFARKTSEPFLYDRMYAFSMMGAARRALGDWIEDGMTSPTANVLREQLSANRPPNLRRIWEIEYRIGRYRAVQFLTGSFSEVFKERLAMRIGHPASTITEINPFLKLQVFGHAAYVSVKMKAEADALINQYDAYWGRILSQLAPGNYHQFSYPQLNGYSAFIKENAPSVMPSLVAAQSAQAQLNLDLAGLDRLCGAPAERIDPFTGGRLNAIDETTTTLIYSVGPDKKDQGGRVVYDPIRGANSPGDMVIRVRK